MLSKFLASSLTISLAAAGIIDVRAAAPKVFNSSVEHGINTECKTCPYSLCPNIKYYESDDPVQLTCYTTGDKIIDDNTWFKTKDNCYVTQWDLVENNGTYTKVIPSCGKIAAKYSKKSSKTIYNTECNLTPTFVDDEDHVKMYKPQVPLTVTCKANTDTAEVLGNPVWYKTLSNCYVPGAQIEPVDENGLDACGPIPFLEKKMRQPDTPESTRKSFAPRDTAPLAHLHKKWLYTTMIGFDGATCTEKPANKSKVIKKLPYGRYLIPQCATFGDSDVTGVRTIYLLTTDFCYVKDDFTDPQLIDDETRAERYPACELFVDTKV